MFKAISDGRDTVMLSPDGTPDSFDGSVFSAHEPRTLAGTYTSPAASSMQVNSWHVCTYLVHFGPDTRQVCIFLHGHGKESKSHGQLQQN